MKIPMIIISIIVTLSVFIPFLLFIINGTNNTSNTKKYLNSLIKDNGIVYSLTEIWRKNFIGVSNDNKILTYIYFETGKPIISNINIHEIKQCQIIKNYNYANKKNTNLKSLYLELSYKSSHKLNTIINFYNVDEDLIENYELQRIEKWQNLILKANPKPHAVRKAS
ncbi:hypothetical protein [Algibacter sp.]|uniref:hypothetical protein n=1 Tax=Algibacter sp. TaxID=1872428 RepID=UPI003C75A66E